MIIKCCNELTLKSKLKTTAAQATVEARHLIVKGAIEIAMGAITELEGKGLTMDNVQKYDLVSSLLIVTTGDKDATPTISIK